MRGRCLCGEIEFEIDRRRLKLYQCHCSLCRRQSGSLANAATLVASRRFHWRRGVEAISSWRKDSGFRSDFCSRCGSPVPNPLRDLPYVWVPAGLLDDDGGLEIVADLCVASRASWDAAPLHAAHYASLPELSALLAALDADAA